jgi:hypothetical protein
MTLSSSLLQLSLIAVLFDGPYNENVSKRKERRMHFESALSPNGVRSKCKIGIHFIRAMLIKMNALSLREI